LPLVFGSNRVILHYMTDIIYVVSGGYNYEGSDMDSVCLFIQREAAESYGRWLVDREGYHFYTLVERKIDATH